MAIAGERFEAYVRDAMREADVSSMLELVRETGVNRGTLYGWFRGEARPRPATLVRMSNALGRTPEQLEAAWDGRDPPVGRFLTDAEIEALVERALRRVLQNAKPSEHFADGDDQSGLELVHKTRHHAPGPVALTLQVAFQRCEEAT